MRIRPSRLALATLAVAAALMCAPSAALAQQPLQLSSTHLTFPSVSFGDTSALPPAATPQTQMSMPPSRHGGIGIGIKGGPLFSSFTGSGLSSGNFSNSTGFQVGLFIGGNRPGAVGVATEINIIQKRSKIKADGSTEKLTALQVPLFLRINGGSSSLNGVNVYVLLGPAIDVNFKATNSILGDIKSNVQNFDVDAVAAVGVEITRFIIEGRYIRGLRNFEKNLQSSNAIKTQAFALLFGVRFN